MILVLLSLLARGQEGFDVHGHQLGDPRPDPRAPVTFAGAAPSEVGWHGAASVEYADAPWITATPLGDTEVRLDELVAVNAALGYAPHPRVRFVLGAPLFVTSVDASGHVQPVAPGDLRLSAVGTGVALDAFDLGLVATAVLPSGAERLNLGLAGPAAELALSSAVNAGRLRLAGATGPAFRPNTRPEERPSPTEGGDAWMSWGAVGVEVVDDTVLGLELRAETALDPEVRAALGSPIELMVAGRFLRPSGVHGFGGIAGSPSRGAGAPALRLLLGAGFGGSYRAEEPAVVAEPVAVAVVEEPPPPPPVARLDVATPDATVWLEHPVCRWIPWAEAAGAIAALPPGTRILVSAPGHLPRWVGLDAGLVELEPAPAQGGLVVLADPLDEVFVDGERVSAGGDGAFLATLPEGPHAVRVVGGGREHLEDVATASGYAIWLRVPRVAPVEVLFEVGQSRLLPRARIALDALKGAQGSWTFELRGSYSPEGSIAANLALARQRAEAVKARLVAAGIPADRITVAEPLPPLPGAPPERQRRVVVMPLGSR